MSAARFNALRLLVLCGLLLAASLSPSRAQTPPAAQPAFPGGAQTVSEDFQDWRLQCGIQQAAKRCAISQQQMDPRGQQRLLAIELQQKTDKVEGVLFLPFGLAIDKGVTLKLGDTVLASPRFSTCLPQGCVVPLSLDAKAIASLKKGTALRIEAQADGGPLQAFTISLKGFGPALERVAVLVR